MRARRLPRAASWVLSALAAIAATVALVLVYADRTLFDSDSFAGRTDAALQTDAVRAVAARRIVDAAITAEPSLVAVRPVLEAAVGAVVGTDAFRSLVRAAARDLHRSAFDRGAGTVTLTVADLGILLGQAAAQLDPAIAARLPTGFDADLARVADGANGYVLEIAERAERWRRLGLIALIAAVVLGLAVLLLSPTTRSGAVRLGASIAVAGGLAAVAAWSGTRLAAVGLPPPERDAVRAAAAVWLSPLGAWALAFAAAGAVVAFAAASLIRPVDVMGAYRRAWRAAITQPTRPASRAARAFAGAALGIALIFWPAQVLELAAVVAGVLLIVAALAELFRLAGTPASPEPRTRTVAARPRVRVAVAALLLVAGVGAAGVAVARDAPVAERTDRCNGHRALCDRPLNEVAFAGTHNSMAADGEAGWLFAAQDAGIPAQLEDGIRALLIDTHYGFATPRGVASELASGSKSREKVIEEAGEEFVRTAERLRKRIGFAGTNREVFLCHGYCEVGATDAVEGFESIHRFLVTHPEEVIVLSIEDDTSAQSTADAIRESGLIREVYLGPAGPPWPTLREMIDRDERVLVLVENDAGDVPWLHSQPEVAQETPYRFRTVAELAADDTCRPNRGGTAGSLLLVNHWVDTPPAPRPSIADEVNARSFLDPRLEECEETRKMLPNIVAVDFYRRGDVFGAVDALNRVR